MTEKVKAYTAFVVALASLIGAFATFHQVTKVSTEKREADAWIVEILVDQLAEAKAECMGE